MALSHILDKISQVQFFLGRPTLRFFGNLGLILVFRGVAFLKKVVRLRSDYVGQELASLVFSDF